MFKERKSNQPSFTKKLGTGFYQKYKEGIDYLIEAKYLEPYMSINYIESENSFYYDRDANRKNATALDYHKTIAALTSLYNAARNPEIKQLLRISAGTSESLYKKLRFCSTGFQNVCRAYQIKRNGVLHVSGPIGRSTERTGNEQ